ncbi:MAG: peroxiredoxin-like family protein [Proteobacteria bacterium]|nr:peroxiredoxin-like family protein [Pseudomonadota bacterium]
MNDTLKTNPNFEKILAEGGPLAQQLDAYATAMKGKNPVIAGAYQSLVDRLIASDAASSAPDFGDELPPFLMPDETGRLVSSADLLKTGPLVISFNRGNWCPFCWLELNALNACYEAICANGGSVVSITPETARYSQQLKTRLGLGFPVLSDLDNGYALELGLVMALSAEIQNLFRNVGTDISEFQKNDAWFVPIPATLVIDARE